MRNISQSTHEPYIAVPNGRPRIQRRLERAKIWPIPESSPRLTRDANAINQFLNTFFEKDSFLDNPGKSTPLPPKFSTPLFTATITYFIYNHWDELMTQPEGQLLNFLRRSHLINSLITLLQKQGIPIPADLQFRVFRALLLVRIKGITP